jgi:hypothetical protein
LPMGTESLYLAAFMIQWFLNAGVAELVDAVDSKSTGSNTVRVRLSPSAPFFRQHRDT